MLKVSTLEKVATLIVSFLAFQVFLFMCSGISSAFNELNTGFSNFIDVTSKIATSATLIWAVYTFTHANKEREILTELEQIRSFSGRLIDYIQSPEFKINKYTANIIISYLDVIVNLKFDKNKSSPEKKLVLDILYQLFRNFTLEELLGVKSEPTYSAVCTTISTIYRDIEKMRNFDPILYTDLTTRENPKDKNISIQPPTERIQPNQIIRLTSFVLEMDENELIRTLLEKPTNIVHYKFPVLFGIYCTYEIGVLFINRENNKILFSSDGILTACRRD